MCFKCFFCECLLDFFPSKSQITTIWEQPVSTSGVWSQLRAIVLLPGLSAWSDSSCFLLLSDPFGKRDEREPLTNAIQSDSAVIGGKPLLVDENRKGTSNSVLWRSVSEPFLMPSAPMTPRSLPVHEPFHKQFCVLYGASSSMDTPWMHPAPILRQLTTDSAAG